MWLEFGALYSIWFHQISATNQYQYHWITVNAIVFSNVDIVTPFKYENMNIGLTPEYKGDADNVDKMFNGLKM